MICTNCGARLMETDQFCPKCGTKAIKDLRCPDCRAVLGDGAKFCPKCGRLIGEKGSAHTVSEDTLDIPIDAIERNILSETAAEIKADHRTEGAPRKKASVKTSSTRGSSQMGEPARKKVSNPEPPRKKRVVYKEDDWDEDDWEDDDWDDDDEGVDVITVMTAVVGLVLLVVVAVLGFHLYRQYVPKNYDKVAQAEQEQQEEQGQDQEQEDRSEGAQVSEVEDAGATYTLTVIHNVNVRDNPSTSGTNVLKVAQEGETYISYGSVDGGEWYEILLEDGSIGYVYYEYVSVE